MRVVALDTSTWWASLGLLEAGRPVALGGLRVQRSHAERLVPMLEWLLDQAGWDRTAPRLYAATRGPGSFTGVRVGLATIQGLSLAAGVPAAGVGTLEALAEAYGPAEAPRVPVLEAGRGEVYAAVYDPRSSPPEEVMAPWVGAPEGILERGIVEGVLVGPAAGRVQGRLQRHARWRGRAGGAPPAVALAVGRLAWLRWEAGVREPGVPAPLYVRRPDAELRHGEER